MNSTRAQAPDPDNSTPLQEAILQYHRIAGQGALPLRVKPGEVLRISSVDQCQCCELLPVDAAAQEALSTLLPEAAPAQLFRRQLDSSRCSAQRLRVQLTQAGVDPARVQAGS